MYNDMFMYINIYRCTNIYMLMYEYTYACISTNTQLDKTTIDNHEIRE
jgi:hypothetical protein